MRRILHILKEPVHPEALALIEQQAAQNPSTLTILLIQEAVRLTPRVSAKTYVLGEDAKVRGVASPFESVDYKKMVEMMLEADTVMMW